MPAAWPPAASRPLIRKGYLRDCAELLRMELTPDLKQLIAEENAQLNREIDAQRTKKVGVRPRGKRPALRAVAD